MAGLPLLVKAALPAVPGVNLLPGVRRSGTRLPDLTLTRHDLPVDAGHVAAYGDLCGFPRKDTLPLPYPHLLAFGLHLRIMTDDAFPYPAIGTVHLENSITQHRPIALGERLHVTAHPANLRPHPKGRTFDLVTAVHSGEELVWEETSTFLRRGSTSATAGSPDSAVRSPDSAVRSPDSTSELPAGAIWSLPADLGRRYARVSGDHNPIHLYPLTAKALGFPRQIAHGMWSMARCVGALENRLPGAVRVEVAFKKPVVLPGQVAFGARRLADGYAFGLSRPATGAPHLAGRTTGC